MDETNGWIFSEEAHFWMDTRKYGAASPLSQYDGALSSGIFLFKTIFDGENGPLMMDDPCHSEDIDFDIVQIEGIPDNR